MHYIADGERCGSVAELFGRGVELQRIARFLDRAQHSGDTRLIRGEPGVGKSALLDAAADQALAAGMHVLRASGSEFEADVSYSGLNQLLLPLRDELGRLPPGAQDALSVALGFGPGPPPGERAACLQRCAFARHGGSRPKAGAPTG